MLHCATTYAGLTVVVCTGIDEATARRSYDRLTALVNASGKMKLLDKLLQRLKDTGHRVLIFSQVCSICSAARDERSDWRRCRLLLTFLCVVVTGAVVVGLWLCVHTDGEGAGHPRRVRTP